MNKDPMMKRRRAITVETERIVIRGELREINWCEACAASTPMVTAEQAAMLIGEQTVRICLRAESGQVHSITKRDGVLMICLRSLAGLPGSEWQTQLKAGPR
jgi:hypothetical protein